MKKFVGVCRYVMPTRYAYALLARGSPRPSRFYSLSPTDPLDKRWLYWEAEHGLLRSSGGQTTSPHVFEGNRVDGPNAQHLRKGTAGPFAATGDFTAYRRL